MPVCSGAGVAEVTVLAVLFLLSWMRVWFVVVVSDWFVHARVISMALAAGASTWITVMAVDVVTAARMTLYAPDGAAMFGLPLSGEGAHAPSA
jgi:hypothetical protein